MTRKNHIAPITALVCGLFCGSGAVVILRWFLVMVFAAFIRDVVYAAAIPETEEITVTTPAVKKNATEYFDEETLTIGTQDNGFTVSAQETVILRSGHSIRLLPGFKVEKGATLLVRVTVKSTVHRQDAEASTDAEVELHPVCLLNWQQSLSHASFSTLPDPNEKSFYFRPFFSGVIPSTGIARTSPTDRTVTLSLTFRAVSQVFLGYTPTMRWGERPETIRVMRT